MNSFPLSAQASPHSRRSSLRRFRWARSTFTVCLLRVIVASDASLFGSPFSTSRPSRTSAALMARSAASRSRESTSAPHPSIVQYADYERDIGGRLMKIVSDLAQLVGWVQFDAGRYGAAERYLLLSERVARAAGDLGRAANAIGMLSYSPPSRSMARLRTGRWDSELPVLLGAGRIHRRRRTRAGRPGKACDGLPGEAPRRSHPLGVDTHKVTHTATSPGTPLY